MDLKQFNLLSKDEALCTLLITGVCVASRHTEEAHLLLFQCSHYYVEVSFSPEGDQIRGSRRFEETEKLEPYLKQINLSGIR